MQKLDWCLKLKNGLKIVNLNERIAKVYLNEAKLSLERAQKNFKDNDLLWTTIVIYYAEYYALYSFLQRIGIKSENHFCSILGVSKLLGEDKVKRIKIHKEKRIDAQYFLKFDKKDEISEMLSEAKLFVSYFDELVSNIKGEEIESYRYKLETKNI